MASKHFPKAWRKGNNIYAQYGDRFALEDGLKSTKQIKQIIAQMDDVKIDVNFFTYLNLPVW